MPPGEPLSRAVEFMADAHALAVQHHQRAGLDFELARSAAYEGILIGLKTFDPDRGGNLRSYVNHKITFAIYDEARAWHARGMTRGVKVTVVPLQEHDLVYVPSGTSIDNPAREMLSKLFLKLNPRQRRVMKLAAQGLDGVQIGKRLGITKGRVSQLFKQIREKRRE